MVFDRKYYSRPFHVHVRAIIGKRTTLDKCVARFVGFVSNRLRIWVREEIDSRTSLTCVCVGSITSDVTHDHVIDDDVVIGHAIGMSYVWSAFDGYYMYVYQQRTKFEE